jgi:ABC-2 type transport system ATP-binding protein
VPDSATPPKAQALRPDATPIVGGTATPAVRTHDLTKVYTGLFGRNRVVALNRLNLEVRRGEVFGLLGPNGSGKTTTMKLLLGLIRPTEGSAQVLGRKPGNVLTNECIGFLPEESYLYRFLNADETLDFYGQLFRIPKAERRERANRLIHMVGLAHARRRAVKGYSKGMSRRIGLAQALINDPELLFLDEPTSGLDPVGTREIKDLILDLKSRGKTVLMCSHLLPDVQDVCDRIAILQQGELKVVGRVDELLTVEDVTQIRVRQLSPDALETLKAVLAEGGREAEISHPRNTLSELFLRIVGANAHDRPRD